MRRVTSFKPAGQKVERPVAATVVLAHGERHLRRKLLHLDDGSMVMLDLKEAVLFHHGDLLEVDDGSLVEIRAAEEKLFEVHGREPLHLLELAWHLGNRHLSVQIEPDRILILRDHVILDMLNGLGARVREVSERFQPLRGAYHSHGGHGHDHMPHAHG